MTGPSRLTVLAGPTAVGKGTVAAYVREHHPQVWVSVSATTRRPRPGEVDGIHYRFVDDPEFDRMSREGELLEWAVVHGRAKYGTPRGPVEDAPEREARLATARVELASASEFDVTVLNDDVRRAAEELVSLMRSPVTKGK